VFGFNPHCRVSSMGELAPLYGELVLTSSDLWVCGVFYVLRFGLQQVCLGVVCIRNAVGMRHILREPELCRLDLVQHACLFRALLQAVARYKLSAAVLAGHGGAVKKPFCGGSTAWNLCFRLPSG